MVKYLQVKIVTAILLALASASAFAAARVAVPSLPEPVRPLAEAETNVVFDAGATGDNLWRLVVELDASASNCVEVVLGVDANAGSTARSGVPMAFSVPNDLKVALERIHAAHSEATAFWVSSLRSLMSNSVP